MALSGCLAAIRASSDWTRGLKTGLRNGGRAVLEGALSSSSSSSPAAPSWDWDCVVVDASSSSASIRACAAARSAGEGSASMSFVRDGRVDVLAGYSSTPVQGW